MVLFFVVAIYCRIFQVIFGEPPCEHPCLLPFSLKLSNLHDVTESEHGLIAVVVLVLLDGVIERAALVAFLAQPLESGGNPPHSLEVEFETLEVLYTGHQL